MLFFCPVEYVIIACTVLFAAGLTFFSGFGLGTIMLPVFSLYFDVPVAVGATAIVHLANNLFKFALVYRGIHYPTLLRFGLPALLFAFIGGSLLARISGMEAIYGYSLGGYSFEVLPVEIVVGVLMIFFAWFELDPRFDKWQVEPKHMPVGGALSGFFGGVSGHQGAFRAAFLSKAGLSKEQFIGTSNSVALIVDMARLSAYFFGVGVLVNGQNKFFAALTDGRMLLVVGIAFAFLGTYFGKKLVQKTTITGIQRVVGILLLIMGAAMILGLIHAK